MSLNWNAEQVKDFDKLTEDEVVTRNSLVWLSMSVGLWEITEKNVLEWYFRVRIHEGLYGAKRTINGEDKFFSFPEIVRFIGLYTNADTFTRNQFLAHHAKVDERDHKYRIKEMNKLLGKE